MSGSQSKAPIGIFDSGIGGLTVVRSMQTRLPLETLCYFGDTARVPYGVKSPETVKRYSAEIARFLKSHEVKLIVAACNTASSVALDSAKAEFGGPVIGVVEPGVRAALAATRNKRIGVIATNSTIKSRAYQDRLVAAAPSLTVAAQACPLFVPLAEEGWTDHPVTRQTAEVYLEPLREAGVDTVILGCTHFPLLSNVIQQTMGEEVTLINSAEEVARDVEGYLTHHRLGAGRREYKHLFYASDDIAGFERMHTRICGGRDAVFRDAPNEFFQMAQQIHRYRESVFKEAIRWFEPLDGGKGRSRDRE